MPLCNLELTFDLAVVTSSFEILLSYNMETISCRRLIRTLVRGLLGLYFTIRNVWEVDTWYRHFGVSVGIQHHGVTLI